MRLHVSTFTPRGTQVNAKKDATSPTGLPGDFPDSDIAMTSLSSLDKYVTRRCLLGADMSECVGREALLSVAERVGEVLAVDILEMYSPECLPELCGKFGLKQVRSLNLTNGFDFDTAVDRSRAWAIIERVLPLLVIGRPPCTYVSMLNELNKHLQSVSSLVATF